MHDYCRVSIPKWMRFRIYSFYGAVKPEILVLGLKHCEIIFGQERTNIIMKAAKPETEAKVSHVVEPYIRARAYEYRLKHQKLPGN